MSSICRLCATLKRFDILVHIEDTYLNLSDKLDRCCQIKIDENDTLPRTACYPCVKKLNASWDFYENVREAQESLNHIFASRNTNLKTEEIILLRKSKDIPNDRIKKFEDQTEVVTSSRDTITCIENQNQYRVSNAETKVENEDFQESFDNEIESKMLCEPVENLFLNVLEENSGDEHEYMVVEELDAIGDQEQPVSIEMMEEVDQESKGSQILETTTHETGNSATLENSWATYSWTCSACSENFHSLEDISEHWNEVHPDSQMTYRCDDCSKDFDRYYAFVNHARRHRTQLGLCCDVCALFFSNYPELISHREKAHRTIENLATCPTCGKAFRNNIGLQTHMICHEASGNRRSFLCEICEKTFATAPNLKAHKKIHLGIKEFVCDECGKDFIQKANLDEHSKIHLSKTPFKCQECGKSFKTSNRLSKHKSVHSDIKPHVCKQCNRAFREKDTLRVHQRIHTGDMPFECEFCFKRFRFRSILSTHLNQHTGLRPYSCDTCNRHFTNWPNYNKHMKRMHNIDKSSEARKAARAKNEKLKNAATSTVTSAIMSEHHYKKKAVYSNRRQNKITTVSYSGTIHTKNDRQNIFIGEQELDSIPKVITLTRTKNIHDLQHQPVDCQSEIIISASHLSDIDTSEGELHEGEP